MKKEINENESPKQVPIEELKKEATEFFEIASAYRKERFSHEIKEVTNIQ